VSSGALSERDQEDVARLAQRVEALPQLSADEVTSLLAGVRAQEASLGLERLVENYLGIALAAARERRDRGLEVDDLFQEGTLAIVAAVSEYAARGEPAAGLPEFLTRVVSAHLEATVEAAEIERRADEAFVRDARLYEVAEVGLRSRLGRDATATEIAGVLEWPTDRVELMAGTLAAARRLEDADLAQYVEPEE